jgi:hypothetical protein
MISESEVRRRLDETMNRLAKLKEAFAKDPKAPPPELQRFAELYFVSRIKTLQEVLGIGAWDERDLSDKYKLDSRKWT